MRPLKPYVVALGGLIAAVFSAVFVGTQSTARPALAPTQPQADLQANRPAAAPPDVVASREARPVGKAPLPQFYFPTDDEPRDETVSFPRALTWQLLSRPRERVIDWRQFLLIGTVELRI